MFITLENEQLQLLPAKALFWPKEKLLIVADLHAGKAAHFRKHGIPVPSLVLEKDIERLNAIIETLKPKKLLFLGDFFHSDANREIGIMHNWMEGKSGIEFHLVIGNHDKKSYSSLQALPFVFHEECLELGPFTFSHDRVETPLYNIYGHIHPAYLLKGKIDSLRLPCFVFGQKYGILPSFGSFTGTSLISPIKEATIFLVSGESIFQA
jgi:uncharacterized protein